MFTYILQRDGHSRRSHAFGDVGGLNQTLILWYIVRLHFHNICTMELIWVQLNLFDAAPEPINSPEDKLPPKRQSWWEKSVYCRVVGHFCGPHNEWTNRGLLQHELKIPPHRAEAFASIWTCSTVITCLFTRLEESSLVPTEFLTAQFLQKTQFMKPLFWWEN